MSTQLALSRLQVTLASIDDAAFKKIPTMGSAADMIDDDLPTNLEYLDDSYSASAGLREFDDEDLDDIGPVDSKETIKILRPEGLNVIEHHFDTLPPDTTTSSKYALGSGQSLLV